MRELIDSFYRDRSIVNHQIASYNDFLERRLQSIVDSTIIGQEEEMERGFIYPEIENYKIKFGKITIGKPEVKEADGTVRRLTPMEARLRDLTYEAPIYLEFIPVKDDVEYDPEEVRVGELPIMIKSNACNLSRVKKRTSADARRFFRSRRIFYK
jgi:DNA-directed RNA polymerase subunit B"